MSKLGEHKTAYGKGTFKTFGKDDREGYLHKYSIAESITDGTTLPLFYNVAPNEMLANTELMENEFWVLAETEGTADIEELAKILFSILKTTRIKKQNWSLLIDNYSLCITHYSLIIDNCSLFIDNW